MALPHNHPAEVADAFALATPPALRKNSNDQFVPKCSRPIGAVGGLNNRDAHNMPSTRAVGQIAMTCCNCCSPVSTTTTRASRHAGGASRAKGCRRSASGWKAQVRKSVRIGDPKKPPAAHRRFSGSFSTPFRKCANCCARTLRLPTKATPPRFSARNHFGRSVHRGYRRPAARARFCIWRARDHSAHDDGWAHSRTGIDIHPGAKMARIFS